MSQVQKDPSLPTIDHKPHAAFFRQSGWLVIAALGGGAFTWLVHFLNKVIGPVEYSTFGVLLTLVGIIPAMPLQMVFAQQTAHALATGRERELSSMIRLGWIITTVLWLMGLAGVIVFHAQIIAGWHLPHEAGLWCAMGAVLVSLWSPLFSGVLQGRQDFFWMGWVNIISSLLRLLIAVGLFFAFAIGSTGMIAGVLIGVGVSSIIGIWRSRDLWTLPTARFDVKSVSGQIVPLFLGFGASQFLFNSDTMFTTHYFDGEQMKPYILAGTLSRALLWVVMPLASVMFPKLVQSSARGEKNNLFGLVVLGTAILSACGVIGLWVAGPLVIRLFASSGDTGATMALIPWYAGAMIPLALANVMVNDLLAKSRFAVVPAMVLLAIAYGFALPWMLQHHPGHMEVALQTLGVFTTLLFAICAFFMWVVKDKKAA